MLLLNTDLWHYGPVVFILGALTIVSILILVFWAIEQREAYLKRKVSTSASVNTPPLQNETRNFWQRFLGFLGLNRKKEESHNNEKWYKERFGIFQSKIIPLLLVGIIYTLLSMDIRCKNTSSNKKTLKPKDSTSNQTGWIPVKSSNSEITDISSYKELKIGETDSFEANVWKKFKFSPSNTKEQKYLNFYLSKSSKDTITLTFKQVSNGREWSWKHWIDKQGDPQCTLHSGELIAFKGDCLVKVDKGCSFNCLIK